jgi:hypothetical protein
MYVVYVVCTWFIVCVCVCVLGGLRVCMCVCVWVCVKGYALVVWMTYFVVLGGWCVGPYVCGWWNGSPLALASPHHPLSTSHPPPYTHTRKTELGHLSVTHSHKHTTQTHNTKADVPDLRESRREAARQLGVETNRVLHFVPYKGRSAFWVCLSVCVCVCVDQRAGKRAAVVVRRPPNDAATKCHPDHHRNTQSPQQNPSHLTTAPPPPHTTTTNTHTQTPPPSPHTPRDKQTDEELRRFAIDRLAYKVLATALQLAAEYVESDEVRVFLLKWLVGCLFWWLLGMCERFRVPLATDILPNQPPLLFPTPTHTTNTTKPPPAFPRGRRRAHRRPLPPLHTTTTTATATATTTPAAATSTSASTSATPRLRHHQR